MSKEKVPVNCHYGRGSNVKTRYRITDEKKQLSFVDSARANKKKSKQLPAQTGILKFIFFLTNTFIDLT